MYDDTMVSLTHARFVLATTDDPKSFIDPHDHHRQKKFFINVSDSKLYNIFYDEHHLVSSRHVIAIGSLGQLHGGCLSYG